MKTSIFAMMIAAVAMMASCGNKATEENIDEPVEIIEHEVEVEETPEIDEFSEVPFDSEEEVEQ
jgi:hypothetical protein